jgi:two-component system response regulator NreC
MLADDHGIFRNGLKALLGAEKDLVVSAEASDGAETIAELKKQRPDILILDLKMPGMPGDKLAQTILKMHPRLPIIILTMFEDEFYLKQLLKIGVRAFILKKSTFTDVLHAIRAVLRGGIYVDPAMASPLVQNYTQRTVNRQTDGLTPSLSDREKEVCAFIAHGFTN